ncbi:MAG: methyltransferase domain-containing protein [Dehalococcoidales bacterium]|nr:methyltransferase domain-containing protein [Dehalococcoidales bacterium]
MTHEFDGEAYKKSSAHQKEWGNNIIAGFHLRGDERILDLGCGDGVLTDQLAELVPNGLVVGIDSSGSMIETAAALRRHNLQFRRLDINSLDYTNEFDLVFSNATLHWVRDHARLLDKCFRSLKKGGMVRFNFAAEGNCSNFFSAVRPALKLPGYSDYFKTFEWPWYMPSLTEYAELVERSQFNASRVWGENADRYFPDSEAMIKWIDQPSLVPFLGYLPAAKKQDFRDYVVDRMLEMTLQPDGRCFETFRRINLSAGK